MWIAKFKLKDDEDIYTPLSKKHKVDMSFYPYSNFIKDDIIHLLSGAIIFGTEKNKDIFVMDLKKDSRIKKVERHHDFLFIYAQHPASREARSEILIFYNPQYIRVKPIQVSSDGWEYWEVACLDRTELNKLVQSAIKNYHGKLFSIQQDKIKGVSSIELAPKLSEKQLEAIKTAFDEGYYTYPRKLTISSLAKMTKKSYSTFQENLRKAENKLMSHFLKYR